MQLLLQQVLPWLQLQPTMLFPFISLKVIGVTTMVVLSGPELIAGTKTWHAEITG